MSFLEYKRAFDLIASGTGLIAFAPIIVAISIAIKLDSQGPIFIRQTRYDYKSPACSSPPVSHAWPTYDARRSSFASNVY